VLLAYNQARYIRDALEAALSQTYEPLQIVVSDDCSSDRTFEIIQSVASEYVGPHQIVLNRNDRNLGIAAHVNKAMGMCAGQYVVLQRATMYRCPIEFSRRCRLCRTTLIWQWSPFATQRLMRPGMRLQEATSSLAK